MFTYLQCLISVQQVNIREMKGERNTEILGKRMFCGDAAVAFPCLKVYDEGEASACSVCPLIREFGLWEAHFILEFQCGWEPTSPACCGAARAQGPSS